jgi:hypothetical protein
MPIKSKKANLIYHGCLLAEAIDELEVFLKSNEQYSSLLSDIHFKRVMIFKQNWIDSFDID